MANIYGGESSWLWEEAGKSKLNWSNKKGKGLDMVTPGLLTDQELKDRLKGLSPDQRGVILQEQELYKARAKIRRQERLRDLVKSTGLKDIHRGRGKITAAYQMAIALLDLLTEAEKQRLDQYIQEEMGMVEFKKVKRPKYTKDDEETILRMAAEGCRDREIADEIKRPLPSVTRKRKELQAQQGVVREKPSNDPTQDTDS
jgi:hypothetical protein